MKINLNAALKDEIGNVVLSRAPKVEKGENGEDIIESNVPPLTLGNIVCQALLVQFPNENIDGAEKNARYKMWAALKDGGEKDVSSEDITRLKKLIGMGWAPLVVGQCWDLLEGREPAI